MLDIRCFGICGSSMPCMRPIVQLDLHRNVCKVRIGRGLNVLRIIDNREGGGIGNRSKISADA